MAKAPPVFGLKVLCMLGVDYLRRGYFRDTEAHWWVLSTTALEVEEVNRCLPCLFSQRDPSVGPAAGQRTGAGHYHDIAPAAALHQLGLHDSHSQADGSAGESSSDQQNHMASVKV